MNTADMNTEQLRIAVAEQARQRRAEAVRLFLAGKTHKEIGEHFGVSRQRASKMIKDGQRDEREQK